MKTSTEIKQIAAALVKAHSAFPKIHKDKTVTVKTNSGGSYKFAYAPLETILAAVNKPLQENDLIVLQNIGNDTLTTMILHGSGEWVESDPIPVKPINSGAQAYGSEITYKRRYQLTCMLSITADDDDDANTADGNTVTETHKTMLHKPTDGAWESLSTDEQTYLNDMADEVKKVLAKGEVEVAVMKIEDAKLDTEEKIALWTRFSSSERSAMKKQVDKTRKDNHGLRA